MSTHSPLRPSLPINIPDPSPISISPITLDPSRSGGGIPIPNPSSRPFGGFVVPALPDRDRDCDSANQVRRPRPRPLSMSMAHNVSTITTATATSTPMMAGSSKSTGNGLSAEVDEGRTKKGLKRLSLVARPTISRADSGGERTSLDTPTSAFIPGSTSMAHSPLRSALSTGDENNPDLTANRGSMSDVPATPGTPRGRRRPMTGMGMRSSISYSPALSSTSTSRAERRRSYMSGVSVTLGMATTPTEEIKQVEKQVEKQAEKEKEKGSEPIRSRQNSGDERARIQMATMKWLERRRSTAFEMFPAKAIVEDVPVARITPDDPVVESRRISTGSEASIPEVSPVEVETPSTSRIKHRAAETLVEKHADLLTMIAQKERKINDLKQELSAQEASLSQLKSRFTAIISRSAPTASPRIRSARSGQHHPLSGPSKTKSNSTSLTPGSPLAAQGSSSMSKGFTLDSVTPAPGLSASSSASSQLSLTTTPHAIDASDPITEMSLDDDLGLTHRENQTLTALLNSLGASPETFLGQDAIEGGKRFWGQLVKTVSAAAGGTVPINAMYPGSDEAGGHDHHHVEENVPSPKLDISSLKSILPSWSVSIPSPSLASPSVTSPSSAKPPKLPSNAARLNKKKANRSRSSLKTPSASSSPAGKGKGKDMRVDTATASHTATTGLTPSSSVGSAMTATTTSSGGVDLLGDDADGFVDLGEREGQQGLQFAAIEPSRRDSGPKEPDADARSRHGTQRSGKENLREQGAEAEAEASDDEDGWGW